MEATLTTSDISDIGDSKSLDLIMTDHDEVKHEYETLVGLAAPSYGQLLMRHMYHVQESLHHQTIDDLTEALHEAHETIGQLRQELASLTPVSLDPIPELTLPTPTLVGAG